MKIFGVESESTVTPIIAADDDAGPIRATGRSEGLRELFTGTLRSVDTTLNTGEVAAKLNKAIEEVSTLIASQAGKIYEGIAIHEVSVELGITTGGEIGLFAKGRLDIAASFSVTFKVTGSEPSRALVEATS